MINIVIGKPGSGKTYHIVKYLYEVLTDLIKRDTLERVIYTNVSVNIDEFNRQLSADFKTEVDISNILIVLTPEDLKYNSSLITDEDKIIKRVAGKVYYSIAASSLAFFWNRFDDNALIVIDEIQKYLSTVREESESERQSLIEYFSLHRHKRHDWYFITQNLLSIPVEVRRVSEKVYNVFNAKSMNIGFPVNIPLRDIETLLAGFNVVRQVYRVREGYLESTYRVVYEDSVDVVVMSKRIFALYQTHTQILDSSSASVFRGDSALPFELGPGQRWRAVRWFISKHGFHLGLKLFLVVWLVSGLLSFFNIWPFSHSSSTVVPAGEVFEQNQEQELISDLQDTSIPDFAQSEIKPENQRKKSFVIYNRVVLIDGVPFRVGEIYNGRRISSINARSGVGYEHVEKVYFDDFVFLSSCSRWLSIVRRNESSNE